MKSQLDRIEDWEELGREAEFRAARLARRCQVSPRQLERYFQYRFHQTPKHWLEQLRLTAVVQEISGGKQVKAAAHDLGFADSSHLIRDFKRAYHVPPLQFLAEQRIKRKQDKPGPTPPIS